MLRRGQWQFWGLAGLILGCLLCVRAFADGGAPSVSCYSPQVNVRAGDTATVNVNCGLYTPDSGNYHLLGSSNNFLSPASLIILNGLHYLTANRQSTVVSPDNTITSIAGTSAGFTGNLLNTIALKNLQFQYTVATTSQTSAGLYSSYFFSSYFQYRICSSSSCEQHVYSGTAPFNILVNVQSSPVTVSCNSPAVNATPGGGLFTLDVTCTISGNNIRQLSPATQNIFSPAAITLSQGSKTVSANLQPTVTSPDSSMTGISGTAAGGFSGTVQSLPATVQVRYQGSTTATTTAGSYTSAPVTFTWSTI